MWIRQDEEGQSLTLVKSMMSFHEVEAQWDAGVCQSATVWQSRAITSGVSQQVPMMQGPLAVYPLLELLPLASLLGKRPP